MSDDEPEIHFDVLWRSLQDGRNWYACSGLLLDVMGYLAAYSDESGETNTLTESVMRALEDHDGTYLASWKRLFRVDKARTVQRWRDNIEPELIRLWTQRAAVEDIEDDDSDAPPG